MAGRRLFTSAMDVMLFVTSLFSGIAMLVGVTAVSSAPAFMLDYYKYLQDNPDATPTYATFWAKVLTFYTIVTLVTQTLAEPLNLTQFMCRFSLMFRLQFSSLLMVVELLVLLLMPHTRTTERGAMAGIIVAAFIGGVGRGVYENTGYALFGPCPSKHMSGILIGAALCGVLLSIVQMALLGAMSNSYHNLLIESILYFAIALAILVVNAVLLVLLLCNPYARRYIAEFRSRRGVWANVYRRVGASAGAETTTTTTTTASQMQTCKTQCSTTATATTPTASTRICACDDGRGDCDGGGPTRRELLCHATSPYAGEPFAAAMAAARDGGDDTHADGRGDGSVGDSEGDVAVRHHDCTKSTLDDGKGACGGGGGGGGGGSLCSSRSNNDVDGDDEDEGDADHGAPTTSELLQKARLRTVVRKVYPMLLSCFGVYFVTYILYPGALIAVDADDDWFTTTLMAVYNVCDFAGRVLTLWKRVWLPRRVVMAGAVARIVFIPLLVLCAVHKIPTHAAAYVITAFLAVSNGFLGTLTMVYTTDTPSLDSDGECALAGQTSGVCLLAGCAGGSLLQLAVVLPL